MKYTVNAYLCTNFAGLFDEETLNPEDLLREEMKC